MTPLLTAQRQRRAATGGDIDPSSEDRVSRALEEYAAAIERGEPLDRDELLAAYADVAEELAGCLYSLEFIRHVAPQLADSAIPSDHLPPASSLQPYSPAALGDFRIVRELGRGGMGVVYEAEQLSLGRSVALKVLPFAAMLDKQQLKRFKNEARAAATLDHPNIVAIYSVGEERGVHYYAMQLIEGESLAQVIARLRTESGVRGQESLESIVPVPSPRRGGSTEHGRQRRPCAGGAGREAMGRGEGDAPTIARRSPSSEHRESSIQHPPSDTQPVAALSTRPDANPREYFRTVARLGMQAAEALDHAHANGILHRDVKPANLLVECSHLAPRDRSPRLAERDGYKLWVTDFGLARLETDAGMTMTGDLVGTLRYMSPEQARAKRVVVDHRSDVYSLGATLYELLMLQPPFDGDDRQELLRQIAVEEPQPPRQLEPRIPQDLETIVLKAMEKNPADRYGTAKELANDLERFLADDPIKASPPNVRQRVAKWGRRHPSLVAAAALVFGISLVLTLLAVAVVGTAWSDAHAAHQSAAAQRDRYLNQRDKALWNLYVADVRLAQEEWQNAHLASFDRLLDAHIPAEGQPDYRGWEWFFLKSIGERDAATLVGHTADVVSVAWSPDGRLAASGGEDHTVRIWDAVSWQLRATLLGHRAEVKAVAWSPDGARLASSSWDNTVRIWDVAAEKPMASIPTGFGWMTRNVVWSPDGSRIASCGTGGLASPSEGLVRIWDARTGDKLLQMRGPSELVFAIAWSPDGAHIAAGGNFEDPDIWIWDANTGQLIKELENTGEAVVSVAWSPDGERVVAAREHDVQVWNAKNGKLAWRAEAHPGGAIWVDWNPDGTLLASVGLDGTLKLWNASGELKNTVRGHRAGVECVDWRFDGRRLATASADHTVKIWDPDRGQPFDVEGIAAVAWYPDGGHTVAAIRNVGDDSFEMQLNSGASWNVRQTAPLPLKKADLLLTGGLAWKPDRTLYAFAEPVEGATVVTTVDHATGAMLATFREPSNPRAHVPIHGLRWNPVLPLLAGAVEGQGAVVWDVTTARKVATLQMPRDEVGAAIDSMAWSPDGRQLAMASWDQRLTVFDVQNWREVVRLDCHPDTRLWERGGENMTAWSPDGTVLAAGSAGGLVILWDTATWRQLLSFSAHTAPVRSIAISPDGRRLATSAKDRTISVWDLADGAQLLTLHDGSGGQVSWSPDGTCLLCSGATGHDFKIWDASAAMSAAAEKP